MNKDECLKIICDVVRQDTGNPSLELTEEMAADDVPGWDSLAHTRIILNIGAKLDVNLDIIESYGLNSIGDLVQLALRSK
jgi:acyl carrier protein